MDIRTRLLDAAAHVYAETGYRGATTRRIAQEAGVNEITLFRHFGSKDALIREALRCASRADLITLPAEPVDPERELRAWCRALFRHLYQSRSVIRKIMGEIEEHPDTIRFVQRCPDTAASELRTYIARLQAHGLAAASVDAAAAAAMLMGALFAEAMGRDIMTAIYRYSVDAAIAAYVRLFLGAIDATGAKAARSRTRVARR